MLDRSCFYFVLSTDTYSATLIFIINQNVFSTLALILNLKTSNDNLLNYTNTWNGIANSCFLGGCEIKALKEGTIQKVIVIYSARIRIDHLTIGSIKSEVIIHCIKFSLRRLQLVNWHTENKFINIIYL